jgi:hypothetical protein
MDLPITAIVLEPDWHEKAAGANFQVESVPSCYHYLCENAFGFTTTHPRYDASWFTDIRDKVERHHGPGAMRLLDSACDVTGECEGSEIGMCVELLLRLAILESQRFRALDVPTHVEVRNG